MHIIHTILLSNLPLITSLKSRKPDHAKVKQWLKVGRPKAPRNKSFVDLEKPTCRRLSTREVENGENEVTTVNIAKLECDDDNKQTYIVKNDKVEIDDETFGDPVNHMNIPLNSNFEMMCQEASLALFYEAGGQYKPKSNAYDVLLDNATSAGILSCLLFCHNIVVDGTVRGLFKKECKLTPIDYFEGHEMRYVYDYDKNKPFHGMWFKMSKEGKLQTERTERPKGSINKDDVTVINGNDDGTILVSDNGPNVKQAKDSIFEMGISPSTHTNDMLMTIKQHLLLGLSGGGELPVTCDEILEALCEHYKQALSSEASSTDKNPIDFYNSIKRESAV